MSGFKRDREGQVKKRHDEFKKSAPTRPVTRNAFTPMFEQFRDELDEHHDRRERIVKASRDITALSKKIIFSLQRVRTFGGELPADIAKEIGARLGDVSQLLATIAPEIQGINRYRYAYSLRCMEELVEALTFAHYLNAQSLISVNDLVSVTDELSRRNAGTDNGPLAPGSSVGGDDHDSGLAAESVRQDIPAVPLTEEDYLYGVFDLSGEMMRFATTTTALTGKLVGASSSPEAKESRQPRTIVQDMQDLGSFFQMLPQQKNKTWNAKMAVLQASVAKVERLGYGITVRGSERGAGWVPDMRDDEQTDQPE